MLQRQERLLNAIVLVLILTGVVFTYLPEIHNSYYRADDYLFLSQVTRYGLARSFLIPFRNHFLPLYRLLMGGLHLVFGSAVPIRIINIAFHLINMYLVFRIVRAHTQSIILSAISSATFAFAFPVVHCIDNCINGVWVTSLSFILLMSIHFEKFFTSYVSFSNEETGEHASACHVRLPPLKYYYLGLLSFTIGLGLFTNAFFGGVILWLFLLARLSFKEGIRKILRDHATIVLAFISIVLIYLALRFYLIDKFFSFQDVLFQTGSLKPTLPFEKKISVIANLWPEFYLYAARLVTPYFTRWYPWFYVFLVVLLAKEFWTRRRQVVFAAMWLIFGFLTVALTVCGRLFFVLAMLEDVHYALAPHYFYYLAAGISIAFGLLLRPPAFLERTAIKASMCMRIALLGMTIALLTMLNYGKATAVINIINGRTREDLKFYGIVTQSCNSMVSFLNSSAYSSEGEFYFADLPAASPGYRSGWFVMQHNIFHVYFPQFTNVSFVAGEQPFSHPNMYMWTPQAVMRIDTGDFPRRLDSPGPKINQLDGPPYPKP
jgi:hypothetical protein